MKQKNSVERRTKRLRTVLMWITAIQLVVMMGMIIYQIIDYTPGIDDKTFKIYEEEFLSFWASVTLFDFILAVSILILKRKNLIQLGKLDGITKFLTMTTCAYTSLASIFLAGDQQNIGGAVLAVVSISLTMLEYFIDKIGSDKLKNTQTNIVKQLEKDIEKSKESYKKIEKKIDESIAVNKENKEKKTKK